MSELVINVDLLEKSGLSIEKFVTLQAIVEEVDLPHFRLSSDEIISELEADMYIKVIGDEIFPRQKAIDLFKAESKTVSFEEFWERWHETTKQPKTDKVAAEKHWRRLKNKEKHLAIKHIEKYYRSLSDKRFCKKARTYLADKNFYDEFDSLETREDFFTTKV